MVAGKVVRRCDRNVAVNLSGGVRTREQLLGTVCFLQGEVEVADRQCRRESRLLTSLKWKSESKRENGLTPSVGQSGENKPRFGQS